MILRKPYAFLIKHFKLIHLILTILMYLFFQRIRELVDFFNYYIDLKTFENITNVVSEHYNMWYIFLPLIIIAVIVIIMWLLITKEKPIKYYIISIITYVIELIGMIVAYVMLVTIQQGEPNVTIITIFRDFLDLLSYLPIPLLIVSLIRGVGFNIKHFNFKKDMSELNIAEEDNEEFEVEVNVDTEDIKSKINRKKRFIKYVYLENKKIFWSVGFISVLIIALGIFLVINSGEKIYKEGVTFKAYGNEVTINKSYKTEYAANGNIVKKDKFFIIVSLNITNTLKEENDLPYENIYLKTSENDKYSPTDDYLECFNEFGIRYLSYDKLREEETKEVILVYEIDNKFIDSDYRLEYLVNEETTENDFIQEYIKIDLKPKKYDKTTIVSTKKIGETLTLDGSLLEGTEITISEIEFSNKYNHKYKQVIGGVEKEFIKPIYPTDLSRYKKTIMRIKVNLKKNKNLNPKVYSSIFEKYATIEYEKSDKKTRQKPNIIDLTPNNSEYVYLEVVHAAMEANEVSLVFTIRDKEYKYQLINKEEN